MNFIFLLFNVFFGLNFLLGQGSCLCQSKEPSMFGKQEKIIELTCFVDR